MKTKEPNIVNGFNFDLLPVRIEYVGKAVDLCDGTQWEHFLWNVTVSYKNGFWSFPYRCGMGHVEKKPGALPMPNPPYKKGTIAYQSWVDRNMQPRKPKISDVLHSVLLDCDAANMSFNDWCADYGYDNDSMKAFKTYQTCCEYAVYVKKAFTKEQVDAMRAALENY